MTTTFFNSQFYLNKYPDIKAAVEAGLTSAEDHFNLFGKFEERSPNPVFDPVFYLAQNPDIATALEGSGVSAFDHFAAYGFNEARAIHPTINLGDYLTSNPDVAAAVAAGEMNAFDHLMSYGLAEPRDLGNGVNLGAFANDPVYQEAVASGDLTTVAARVADVSPFIPTFKPAAGWKAPTDLPIPTDFKPVDGEKLVIPAGVKVPAGTELPDFIEPAKPTPPVDSGGGGTGGGSVVPTPDVKPIFSGNIEDAFYTYAVKKDAIEGLESYTLTGGSLDISETKDHKLGGGLLDLSKATITGDVTVTLATLDTKKGNKGDLDGDVKSDQSIKLPSLDKLAGANLTIENMTISATAGYTKDPVTNDVVKFNPANELDFANKVSSIQITEGDFMKGESGLKYVNMVLTFNTDDNSNEFTLTLKNLVSKNVYNNMLKALDMVNEGENTTSLVKPDFTFNDDFSEESIYNNLVFSGSEVAINETKAIVGLVGILVNEGTFVFEA